MTDRECSAFVKARDKRCQWGIHCVKSLYAKDLEWAHIFGRGRKTVRTDPENAVTLCHSCHWYAHKEPNKFTGFVKEWMGNEKYEELRRKAETLKVS